MFTLEQGKKLVDLARHSIETFFTKKNLELGNLKEELSEKQGVFVTLTKDGELRGCIGYPEPVFPLYKAVIDAARAAAFQDPRFPPLSRDELKEIAIEVSVLTIPQEIKVEKPEDYLDEIIIGEDGLIIRCMYGSGLLLPQVATEFKWDVKTFLEHLCLKANLPSDEWMNIEENKIYKFQAQIFAEKEGKVVEKAV